MTTPAGTVTAASPSPRVRITSRASRTAPAVRVGAGQDQGGHGAQEAAGAHGGADDEQGQGPVPLAAAARRPGTPSRSGLPPRRPANLGSPVGPTRAAAGRRPGSRRATGRGGRRALTGCRRPCERAGHAATPQRGERPDAVGRYRRRKGAGRAGAEESPRGWLGLPGTRTPAAPPAGSRSHPLGGRNDPDGGRRPLGPKAAVVVGEPAFLA
jgi:hypothetical protein